MTQKEVCRAGCGPPPGTRMKTPRPQESCAPRSRDSRPGRREPEPLGGVELEHVLKHRERGGGDACHERVDRAAAFDRGYEDRAAPAEVQSVLVDRALRGVAPAV